MSDEEAPGPSTRAAGMDAKPPRVYQQWEGNEVFLLGGRLMAGPNWPASIATAALVLVPTGIFLAWPAWYLGHQVNWALFVFGWVWAHAHAHVLCHACMCAPCVTGHMYA